MIIDWVIGVSEAPGGPGRRAAERRSGQGCVGGGATRAHLRAAARARVGWRSEGQPSGGGGGAGAGARAARAAAHRCAAGSIASPWASAWAGNGAAAAGPAPGAAGRGRRGCGGGPWTRCPPGRTARGRACRGPGATRAPRPTVPGRAGAPRPGTGCLGAPGAATPACFLPSFFFFFLMFLSFLVFFSPFPPALFPFNVFFVIVLQVCFKSSQHAFFSCRPGDRDLTLTVRSKVSALPSLRAWAGSRRLPECRCAAAAVLPAIKPPPAPGRAQERSELRVRTPGGAGSRRLLAAGLRGWRCAACSWVGRRARLVPVAAKAGTAVPPGPGDAAVGRETLLASEGTVSRQAPPATSRF